MSGYTQGGEFLEKSNNSLHFAKGCVLLKYQDTTPHAKRTLSRHSQQKAMVKMKLFLIKHNTYECRGCRGQLKCDGTHAETRFRISEKRKSPFKSAGGVSSVDY